MALAASGSVGETIAPRANAAGQVMPVDHRVGDHGHRDRGGQDQPDRGHRDRPGVGPQVAGRGEEAGPVQQRRQEHHQDQLGRQLDAGMPGSEPEHQPAEDEQDRIGHANQPGQDAQPGHGDHQRQQQRFDLVQRALRLTRSLPP